MIINYEYYQIFYYVAANKNITEAANQLFLSQSTVSRAIQNLERDLGCTLLIRSKQGLALTEEGQFLYEYVQKAHAFISIAETHLSNAKELSQGILRIGATELTLQHYLLPYIKKFETLFPNIHVEFDFEYPESAAKKLNAGLLDLAILTSPLKEMDSINQKLLKKFEQTIIAGTKYQKYSAAPVDFQALSGESFVLMKEGTSARAYADKLFEENNMSVFPKYESGSTPLVVSMVEQNLGIGLVPKVFIEEKLNQGSLLEIKTKEPIAPLEIYALTSNLFQVSAIRDKFLLLLGEE